MQINARNFAAALAYLGADVESAMLDIVAVSPAISARLRAILFADNQSPKLRYIKERDGLGSYFFTDYSYPRWISVMHAADYLCLVIGDDNVLKYLKVKFSEYNLEVLIEK